MNTHWKSIGLRRVVKAGRYSLNGLRLAAIHEAAFRQECLLALLVIPLTLVVPATAVERVLLIGVTLLVLIVELLNSVIEAVVDRVGLEAHQLSGQAKDMGSAAVLLSLLSWVLTWGVILVS